MYSARQSRRTRRDPQEGQEEPVTRHTSATEVHDTHACDSSVFDAVGIRSVPDPSWVWTPQEARRHWVSSASSHDSMALTIEVESQPKRNAPVVDRLLDAGMTGQYSHVEYGRRVTDVAVLGKANMSVLNGWFHPGVPYGWSPSAGQVKSAYGEGLVVGGSSTGCAVAISAGMCPVAIGQETIGSIVSGFTFIRHIHVGCPTDLQITPADRAGVVGFKPTHGLIGTELVMPIECALFQ